LDFKKKLNEARTQELQVDPLKIFQRLPKPPHINDLWESQSEALRLWGDRRQENDLVIKLNTGGGKTLVGLLISQAIANETGRSVLYLCPNNQLVNQTHAKATEVSIPTVLYERGRGDFPAAFLNGKSIMIATYSALFHGRSKFGLLAGGNEPTDLGGIICDDAHVAFSAVRDAFTIDIKRNVHAELYQELCTRFRGAFEAIGRIGSFDDVLERDDQAVLEVPYAAWLNNSGSIREQLARSFSHDFRYQLPLLRDNFDHCHALISARSFSITPLLPLVQMLPSFHDCKRRVYMSATIADDSSIIRTFGASAKEVQRPIIPISLAGVGERMILAPSLMNFAPQAEYSITQTVLAQCAKSVNTLILTGSEAATKRWCPPALTASGDNVDSAVQQMLHGHTQPLALANRYDGIDLPGDGCRVLVFDGLPKGSSAYDSYRSEVLRGTSSLNLSLAQRIEQGLGRATRGAGDFCVVLLTGSDLTSWITRSDSLFLLTPSTRAQVIMGLDISRDINSPEDLMRVIQQCLTRDPDWARYHAETLADRAEMPAVDLEVLNAAATERHYFSHLLERQYDLAAEVAMQKASQHFNDRRLRGWFLYLAARAYHLANMMPQAEEAQRSAHQANALLWLPTSGGSQYLPHSEIAPQTENILAQISKFTELSGHVRDFDDAVSSITPVATSNQLEQGLERLGEFLGFHAERPEKQLGVGPDVLWLPSDLVGLVIESKGGKQPKNALSKGDHGQLLVSAEWFKREYPNRQCVRIQVHANQKATEPAMAHDSLVITFDGLGKLIAALREVLAEVCSAQVSKQQRKAVCDKRLREKNLIIPNLIETYCQKFETV
jgi:Type III restriction enzyme, res subunit